MLRFVAAAVLAKVNSPEGCCLAVGQGRDLLAIVNDISGSVAWSTALLAEPHGGLDLVAET